MAYPNDPVYWINMTVSPSNGITDKIIIPLIKFNNTKSLDWNYSRFLPDADNPTGEYYYSRAKMNNNDVNLANKIAHSLTVIPYPNWVKFPYESQPFKYEIGEMTDSPWYFSFKTSCSELPPESWSLDPFDNIQYRDNGFDKWETHWYRNEFTIGLNTKIQTDFSNDGVYIQKYNTGGTPCHGQGSVEPPATPVPSTMSYYIPYQEGMIAVVGLYKSTFDDENPSVDDIEDFAIITNVNKPSYWTGWNYHRMWEWEHLIVHHNDDPDIPPTPPPTEDDMEIKKPWIGSFFNRVYACKRDHVTALANYIAHTMSGHIQDFDDWLIYVNAMFGGFADWLDNIVDITIFPFNVPLRVDSGTSYPVYTVRFSPTDVGDSGTWANITFNQVLYHLKDSTECLFDATGWFLISRKFNDFRDFPPYRRSVLYIPFIGEVEFNVHNYYGKYMKIKYAVDIMNGGCRAFICIASSNSVSDDGIIVASYDGQMGIHCPITSILYSDHFNAVNMGLANTISSATNSGANLASSGAKVSKGSKGQKFNKAVAGSMASGIFEDYASVTQLNYADSNTPVSTTGSSSSCLSAYTDWTCRILWYESKTTETSNLLQLSGYPSNKSGTIGSFSGFLSVSSCEISCPKATERERNMIKSILTEGIHI